MQHSQCFWFFLFLFLFFGFFVFEKDGLEAFTNTPLYSLLIQRRAARSELHGQAFSPALFYKVGRAGLDAGGRVGGA